jgi:cytochrome P450
MATAPRDERRPEGEKDLVSLLISAAHETDDRLSQDQVDTILGLDPHGGAPPA